MWNMDKLKPPKHLLPTDHMSFESQPHTKTDFQNQKSSNDEHPSKKRRMLGKQAPEFSLESLQDVIKKINTVVSRVGKREIVETTILQQLGHSSNDKEIVKVVACPGTDRTIGPPNNLLAAQAPYRKALMVARPTGEVQVEANWENWSMLSKRQLIRPSQACRLNITMFSRNSEVQKHTICPEPVKNLLHRNQVLHAQ